MNKFNNFPFLELFARRVPYEGWAPPKIILEVVHNHTRPTIPDDCPPRFAELIKCCTHNDPDKRPTMQKIIVALRTLMNEFGEVQSASLPLEAMELTLGPPKILPIDINLLKWDKKVSSCENIYEIYTGTYGDKKVYIKVFAKSEYFNCELKILQDMPECYVLHNSIGYGLDPKFCLVFEYIFPDLRSYLINKVILSHKCKFGNWVNPEISSSNLSVFS